MARRREESEDSTDDAKRGLQLAMRALARRPRTTTEIEALLRERALPGEVVAATLERLRERAYLDDGAVVEAVVRDGERRHIGSVRIAQVLARRGLSDALVERARAESAEGDLERARRLVARRFRLGFGEDSRRLARAARLLRSRGYPGAVVRAILGDEAAGEGDADPDAGVVLND
ncbi:MAG: regulatory protein RecX [Deltaproteobacteria bacterium]|nr:regulatory protein RecX [Deltaproteobacteria bacterium]